jgi:lambda family phage tail tape measure protein
MEDTTISLGVDSSQVRSAKDDLDKFAKAGDKAEHSIAKIEAAFKRQEQAAQKFGVAIGAAVAAAGAAAISSIYAIDRLIKSVGDYQDLADQTGSDPAGLASLRTAADVAGVSLDDIGSATARLSVRLAKVNDESKGAGKALAAIGIEVNKFKQLRPDEQYRAIADALDGYADGASKVVIANELFGKGSEKQLKVLKELAGQTGENNFLTNEQIALADDYADNSARLQSRLSQLAQVAALQSAPALLAMKTALFEAASETVGVNKAAGDLSRNTGVQDFAESAARSLGFVVDASDGLARSFQVVGGAIGAVAASAAAVASGEFRQAKSILADLAEQTDAILQRELFSTKLERALAKAAKASPTLPKRAIDTSGLATTTKGRKGRVNDPASAQLAADIDAIKQSYEQQADAFKNAESILDALRNAGLVQDRAYYEAKQQFIERNADAQIKELDAENQRLASEKATGSERIRLDKQIADNKAKIAIIEADASAKVTVNTIQQADALTKLQRAYAEAEASAQSYLDTLKQSQDRQIAGFGLGDKAQAKQGDIQRIRDDYEQQRQLLEAQRRSGQISDDGYAQELDRIKRFQAAALSQYENGYAQIEERRKRADLGASAALQNYFDQTQDTYGQIKTVVTDTFQGAEDALTQFVTTGKLSFTGLANSIISDLARIAIRQSITGPLAKALLGGGDGGGFSSFIGSFFGAGKADGGSVAAGGLYPINERGAEVLTIGSRDYLTMGSQGGKVTPIKDSGGNTVNVTVNQSFAQNTSRATTMQAAVDARRVLEYAGRNL